MKTTARVSTFFIVCLLLFSPILVEAGPGQGLAVAPDGTVYFSGISNVYKIDPQGNTTVFVNKNTMELHLDGKYLYGRYHDWPNNRYWRADLNGHVIDVSPEVAAWFFGGVDDAGYVYTLHADRERNWIEKTGLDGEAVVLAGGAKGYADGRGKKARFGGFGTAAWGPDECLYVAGGGMVRRVTPEGMVTTYAGPEQGFEGGRYSMLMAIDFDPQGNLYISDPVQKKIFKMTPEGEVVLLMSSGDWRPTGLTVANGAVYVLEYGSRNAPRVRKIAADGSVTTIGNADGA
jgi:hypothetical protein